MIISIVVAMDENCVIGANGALPWHLPADLQHFRSITMGKPIVMGRRTHQAIGRALPGRKNIVVTRDRDFQAPGSVIVRSLEEAFVEAGQVDEVMVIGGAELYAQTLVHADRIYLTEVHADVGGDVVFPPYDVGQWHEVQRAAFPNDDRNPIAYSFVILERRP
ncbi:MAG: dihydrofolate reductase [Gammaproteobacteria bacterium]|jgi:dihydrofolate reductase|nr:dihydrofolate reductase [Gammaproteobacteria bacterium]